MNIAIKDLVNKFEQIIINYVQKSCVFLIPGTKDEKAKYVGSGLLLSTSNQNPVILTAKHVIEDATREEFRLGFYKCNNSIDNFIKGIIHHPDNLIDLSLVIPDIKKVKSILSLAVNSEDVFLCDDRIKAESYKIIVGFPSGLVFDIDADNDVKQGFGCFTFLCDFGEFIYDSDRKICINWDDLVLHNTNISLDKNFKPSGLSGGSLWIFPPIEQSRIWSPSHYGYVIGILSKWNHKKNLVKVEPLATHFEWLKEQLKLVDDFIMENTEQYN